MNRRDFLKKSIATSGVALLPIGVLGLVGRSGLSGMPDVGGFDGTNMGTGYSVRVPMKSGFQ